MTLTAQIIGIFAMAANVAAYQFKNKRIVILCQLAGSVLFAVNMFMLDALMGGLLNVVGIVRAIVYINKDRLKIPVKLVNGIFMALYLASYILVFTVFGKEPTAFNLLIEILPLIGMGAMTVGLSMKDSKAIRVCGFINSPCWLIYNSLVFSLGGILCEVFGILSVITAYIRLDMKTKRTGIKMKTVALNGIWKYRVGFGDFSDISVPFSRLPVGRSECVKKFDMLELSDKIFLKFDGITYYAEVTLNGVALGEMLPYSEYEFDVTEIVKQKENTLAVVLEDINRAFGPSNGWENFGGIIRDVYLELRGKYYIENVFFKSSLCDNYANADMSIDISAKCPSDAYFKIELFSDGELASSYTQKAGEIVTERVNGVKLWSPDTPKLYSLAVSLICDGEVCDVYTADVGFKEFLCDRHRFVLNGKHLFLKGVCKHEMVGDSGHSPSVTEMENDMRMIKEMGCNFVRLVHYPHNKKILEIADRLGLMVSEEPGLWWSDTSLPEVATAVLRF